MTGQGSDAVRSHVGAPRVSVLPISRLAAADYMAGPALARRPKRVERGARRQTGVMVSSPRTSLRGSARTLPRGGRSVTSFVGWSAS